MKSWSRWDGSCPLAPAWTPAPELATGVEAIPSTLAGAANVEEERRGAGEERATGAGMSGKTMHGGRGYKNASHAVLYSFENLHVTGQSLSDGTAEEG